MKKVCRFCNHIRATLAKIHLVDKFLIIFMSLLLAQSAFNLFVNNASPESGTIDVIVRTSTAAIFGYFLSSNFIRHSSVSNGRPSEKNTNITPSKNSGGIQNRIGFSAPDSPSSGENPNIGGADFKEDTPLDFSTANRIQVVAASAIGLFCLITLLILRDVAIFDAGMKASASMNATVAQFRDIVSGCIGFLIGSPTSGTKNS